MKASNFSFHCSLPQVNGQSLLGSSHQEAVRALRSIGDKLTILVCDQPAAAPPSPTPAPGVTGKIRSQTHSSSLHLGVKMNYIVDFLWKLFFVSPLSCLLQKKQEATEMWCFKRILLIPSLGQKQYQTR